MSVPAGQSASKKEDGRQKPASQEQQQQCLIVREIDQPPVDQAAAEIEEEHKRVPSESRVNKPAAAAQNDGKIMNNVNHNKLINRDPDQESDFSLAVKKSIEKNRSQQQSLI